MDRNMDKVKEFYDKYKVYLTRQNLELLAVTVIVLSAILVFTSGIPGKGVLTLDQGKIKYDGTLVRGKMNGQGIKHIERLSGNAFIKRKINNSACAKKSAKPDGMT